MRHDADDMTPFPPPAHQPEPLTFEERAAFAALPRERLGSAELEDRVVRALAAQSLLRPRFATPEVTRRSRLLRRVGMIAAALIVFTAGATFGRLTTAGREPASALAASSHPDSASVALLVQRAGSEFVHTLERIPSATDSADARRAQEQEVARSTLRAAAQQVARVSPDDPLALLILERLQAESGQLVWF